MTGKDRIQRIWRREGLKVPKKQPKRARLWLNNGSCIRLRPKYPNHVWSFDFVETQTHDGRRIRRMTLIDEFTRKCLAIHVARRTNAIGVIETLADAMLFEGMATYIRSDNGPEMVAKVLREWLTGLTAHNITACKPGLRSPFLSTRLVHYHAATLHILSPPLTTRID